MTEMPSDFDLKIAKIYAPDAAKKITKNAGTFDPLSSGKVVRERKRAAMNRPARKVKLIRVGIIDLGTITRATCGYLVKNL